MIKTEQRSLYSGAVAVDEKTGLPADYNSFFEGYRKLLFDTAHKLGIPIDAQDEAVQEVQLKFWLKNGLDMYDPDRGTKFATFLKRWGALFMLQERDKSWRQAQRFSYTDPAEFSSEYRPELNRPTNLGHLVDEKTSEVAIDQWVSGAKEVLIDAGRPDLIPVLELCANHAKLNSVPTRAQIAECIGGSVMQATTRLNKLRDILRASDYGIESLYE